MLCACCFSLLTTSGTCLQLLKVRRMWLDMSIRLPVCRRMLQSYFQLLHFPVSSAGMENRDACP